MDGVTQPADDIWLFDGPDIPFLGLTIPTRMTIIRIGMDLWVHSPVSMPDGTWRYIDSLGHVAFVVAPNKLHHLFLPDWQERYSGAVFYAAPGLREKRPDVRFDDDLVAHGQFSWSGSIEHIHFTGSRAFEEVIFFHPASRTLILTDLILNVRIENFNWLQRAFARFDGIAYPDGMTPRLFRWSMRNLVGAQQACYKMLEWDPERVVISHGEWFSKDGASELRSRLNWVASGPATEAGIAGP